jgi:hypothetical protein
VIYVTNTGTCYAFVFDRTVTCGVTLWTRKQTSHNSTISGCVRYVKQPSFDIDPKLQHEATFTSESCAPAPQSHDGTIGAHSTGAQASPPALSAQREPALGVGIARDRRITRSVPSALADGFADPLGLVKRHSVSSRQSCGEITTSRLQRHAIRSMSGRNV